MLGQVRVHSYECVREGRGNPCRLTSPVVRPGGPGSLVSFLITMINIEQVLTVCQVLARPRRGPRGDSESIVCTCWEAGLLCGPSLTESRQASELPGLAKS